MFVLIACESLKMMLKMSLRCENEGKLAGIAHEQKGARKADTVHHGICDAEGVEGAIFTTSSMIPGIVPVYSVVQLEPCIVYFALIYSDWFTGQPCCGADILTWKGSK